jgi:predicted transglutaminase-like cysteine proteinase
MLIWPDSIEGESFSRTCERVQAWAQSIFEWRDDQQVWGEPDFWASPAELEAKFADGKLVGDCDDYAGLCVHALRMLGLEARCLLCWCETGGYHATCLARSPDKTWVLDNRFQNVMSRKELEATGYKWHVMSSARAGGIWSEAT